MDGNVSAEILDIFDIPSRKTVESVILQLLMRLDSELHDNNKEAGVLEQVKLNDSLENFGI